MASGFQSATTLDPTLSLEIDDQGRRLLFTVTPPAYPVGYDQRRVSTPEEASLPRGPVDFVIAIDISGSTAAQAPVVFQDPAVSEAKAHLLRSQIDLPLTRMEARGKQKALIALDRLQPQDRTNLWEGLKTAMDLLNEPPRKLTDDKPTSQPLRQILPGVSVIPPEKAQVEKNKPQEYRRASIFLFTDATPDAELEPYRGFVVELETYLRNKKRDFTINSFGIGSAIHSSLLHEIASIGGGRFSFVDDASRVGEAVTYAVANEMAVFGNDLRIRLTVETGDEEVVKNVDVVGWPGAAPFSYWTFIAPRATNLRGRASFGPLEYGQSRSFILEFKKDVRHTSLIVSILCRLRDGSEASYPIEVSKDLRPTQEMPAHSTRLTFISLANGLSDSRASGLARIKHVPPYLVEAIQSLKREIQARPTNTSSPLDQALLADLDGKVSQLLADDTAFRRWGFHYILSLAQAYQLEQCSNSDDPGLQLYGGSEYFRALKAEITEAVETLGPPKASQRKSVIYGGKKGLKTFPEPARPPPPPQPTLTERFIEWYTKSPPVCMDGECHIDLADGSTVKLVDLKLGTKVRTSLGASEVVGILKTVVDGGTLELCSVGSRLWITPWHPVRLEGHCEWQFPAQIATPERRTCTAVYSLVLESKTNPEAHSVYVGGVCCVTLGHGVTAEASRVSRSHPFFSDYDAVMEALSAAPAHARIAEGIIQVAGLTRDPITGLANGFQWEVGTH
ncbi:hypothetical protein M407DRAFT_6225 [Tulasnella calospora MUT 4182]|uniref:VWFA domain-containing protein n=1 Tax=Tulasnella calospora MUT 4182 TaxID=1051891 RepID=A0A0C3QN51_9AGAM|nr:hypothetical protein M407DRAFT_6225 [Tulasnella calospora MUT 4182]